MDRLLLFVIPATLSIALTGWVVRRDMRRLTPHQLARSWNEVSFWIAVVVFGPLCLPVHFAKSRRRWSGVLLGVIMAMLVSGAAAIAAELMSWGLADSVGSRQDAGRRASRVPLGEDGRV